MATVRESSQIAEDVPGRGRDGGGGDAAVAAARRRRDRRRRSRGTGWGPARARDPDRARSARLRRLRHLPGGRGGVLRILQLERVRTRRRLRRPAQLRRDPHRPGLPRGARHNVVHRRDVARDAGPDRLLARPAAEPQDARPVGDPGAHLRAVRHLRGRRRHGLEPHAASPTERSTDSWRRSGSARSPPTGCPTRRSRSGR